MALRPVASVPLAAVTTGLVAPNQPNTRRSADYKPTIWSFEYIQSLKSDYVEDSFSRHLNKSKEAVKLMLEGEEMDKDTLHQLELIDTLQRLGLSYHFENKINGILKRVYNKNQGNCGFERDTSLYGAAIEFRLLRQHGYKVPQEIFNSFMDESGNFKACLANDCKGMLYLFEASFVSMDGERILDAARTFTRKYLNEYAELNKSKDLYISTLVEHALEFPLYWRMPRMEARWFIEVYSQSPDMNPILLDLAKLDFNMVQAVHQEDLKHASRWWKRTGFGQKLGFARDRLVESFLWAMGISFQPQYGYFRRIGTQLFALITAMDDVYDVYGTLDELELFTDAIERWDINEIEQLPDYMKLCFFTVHNTVNQMASDIFQEQGINILPYSKKALLKLCKADLLEAKWYHEGYTPSLHEYIDNALISIGCPAALLHTYILSSNHITTEVLQYLEGELPNVLRCTSIIIRLADDLGTSADEMRRGDVPKSIQCYMHETGASEAEAREYIRGLIDETWKQMNKAQFQSSPLPETWIVAALDAARTAQFMFRHGDGHGRQDHVMKNRVLSLLINPIPWP